MKRYRSLPPLAATLDSAAEAMGCSRPTLENMISDPACPITATRYRGRRFVSVESLRTFLASAS